jgi:GT2 family glycosyltransferase
VIPAYGDEPLLERCVASALHDEDHEVVVVDNGCTTDAVERVERYDRVRVVRPGYNTGFAAGCNLGVSQSDGDVVVLLNSDAIARPGATAALAGALDDRSVGIATASVRLLADPRRLNSSGNPVHFLGLTWSGNLGRDALATPTSKEVASASGAAMAMRAEDWRRFGGFFGEMFAYYEDVELSQRVWLDGLRVVYVPEAEVWHDYSFSRNPDKYFLLERNRLLMVSTIYQSRTLALLAVPLLGFELAMLVLATKEGWARQKVRSWVWLLTHLRMLRERRSLVQGSRREADAVLLRNLTGDLDPGAESGIRVPTWAAALSRGTWRCLRLWVRLTSRAPARRGGA